MEEVYKGSPHCRQDLVTTQRQESCPDYGDIRQPSVDPTVFNISDFAGTWYMVATTEPTLPAFCTCTRNEVSVHLPEGWCQ